MSDEIKPNAETAALSNDDLGDVTGGILGTTANTDEGGSSGNGGGGLLKGISDALFEIGL